jgi:hypothetical protein
MLFTTSVIPHQCSFNYLFVARANENNLSFFIHQALANAIRFALVAIAPFAHTYTQQTIKTSRHTTKILFDKSIIKKLSKPII